MPVAYRRTYVRTTAPHHIILTSDVYNREKYVTRSEYDELKARFDTLEGTVNSLLRAGSTVGPASTGSVPMAPPYYQMNPMAPAVPSYNPPPHPPQQQPGSLYGMMSSSPYMQPTSRYPGPESPRTATSPRHMHPPMQQSQQSPSTSPTIAHPHSPTRNPKSPTSATGPRQSPLTLASLTSPPFSQLHATTHVPPSAEQAQSQSKNCHGAQMCERLRLADTARSHNNSNTPHTPSSGGAQWRARRGAPWSITTRTRGGTAMRRWGAPGCSSSSRATRTARHGICTTSETRGWVTCASGDLAVPAV